MIIGIDPGVKGGMALLTSGGEVVEALPFEGMTRDALEMSFRAWRDTQDIRPENSLLVIEKVGYIKGDGGKGSFTFGNIAGLLEGLGRGVLCLRPLFVYPMMWQSALLCLSGGNKNVTKNMAISLFPQYHAQRPRGITHGIADALLIAEWGRRTAVARTPPPVR
jgi:hypothetical protein